MIRLLIYGSLLTILLYSCTHTKEIPVSILTKHSYRGNNDSIEQTLELIALDSLHTQFILQVENKYQDTIDSYMSSAVSVDHRHYSHVRNKCRIDFEIKGMKEDTAIITFCECPELTVRGYSGYMKTDSLMNDNVYR